MTRPTIQHLELEPRAGDFLEMMRDLGHMDDASVEKLTGKLVSEGRSGRQITFEELRRAVAIHLFESEATMRPEVREVLNQEWARLFS
jgi:hypothetical protein